MGIKLDTSAGEAQHESLREATIRKRYLTVAAIVVVIFGLLILTSLIKIISHINTINKYEKVYEGLQLEYNELIASQQAEGSETTVSDNSIDKNERVIEITTAVEPGDRVAEIQNCLYDDYHKGTWTSEERAELSTLLNGSTNPWLYYGVQGESDSETVPDTIIWEFKTPFGVDPEQSNNKLYNVTWECWASNSGNQVFERYLIGIVTANYDYITGTFDNIAIYVTPFGEQLKDSKTGRVENPGKPTDSDLIIDMVDHLEQSVSENSNVSTDTDAETDAESDENTDVTTEEN